MDEDLKIRHAINVKMGDVLLATGALAMGGPKRSLILTVLNKNAHLNTCQVLFENSIYELRFNERFFAGPSLWNDGPLLWMEREIIRF